MSASVPQGPGGAAWAVVTAAGSGTRLGCEGPKALVPVAGVPMVVRAVGGLLAAGIAGVVVTAPEDALEAFRAALSARPEDPRVQVVAGSASSRQASVARGLAALPGLARRLGGRLEAGSPVLVHDAARCLTPADLVRRVVAAVEAGAVAVVPGLPVADTLKEIAPPEGGAAGASAPLAVVGTPDRTRLRAVQTPQGFTWNVLARAHRAAADRAGSESTAVTDDAGLVESLGLPVAVVDGDQRALKVTTPLDLAVAELLARSFAGP